MATALVPLQSTFSTCRHCGEELAHLASDETGAFCCSGCRFVHGLLLAQGLERYYDLRGSTGERALGPTESDKKWLEPLKRQVFEAREPSFVDLDIQGIHCAGCVWLITELAQRKGAQAIVNPALGRMRLYVRPQFDLEKAVSEIEQFGYRLGLPKKREAQDQSEVIAKMGICVAIAMNGMILSIAIYAGLNEPMLRRLFDGLSLGLTSVAVAIGGSVFVSSAFAALRRRILHLDLPIALAIVLAYLGSVVAYFSGRLTYTFFDTLNVFIALMLAGRVLQESIVIRNRQFLLESEGAFQLQCRKIVDEKVTIMPCSTVTTGDELLVVAGDFLCAKGVLESPSALVSLEWISGESEPKTVLQGEQIPAGAVVAGSTAIRVQATENFDASEVSKLLSQSHEKETQIARIISRFSRYFVGAVLVVGVVAFGTQLWLLHPVARAFSVLASVWIVSCPCAFGIGLPVAFEMMMVNLRRHGFYARKSDVLERLRAVKAVVFDKTGTLTLGCLRVSKCPEWATLSSDTRAILYQLAISSSHPKSVSIARFVDHVPPIDRSLNAKEFAGEGMELQTPSGTYRLGSPRFALGVHDSSDDVIFARDSAPIAIFSFEEILRDDVVEQVAQLKALGLSVWILSGDQPAKVDAVARRLGLPHDHVRAMQSPSDKRKFLQDLGQKALFFGDGINDIGAIGIAHCAGTPAIDHPFVASRSDFFTTSSGIRPLIVALVASHAYAAVVRVLFSLALAYNLAMVSIAFFGALNPLLCAVLMPVSSVTVLLVAVFQSRAAFSRATQFKWAQPVPVQGAS